MLNTCMSDDFISCYSLSELGPFHSTRLQPLVFTSRDNTEIQHQQVKSLINAGTDVPSIHCDGYYNPVDYPISDCPIVHSTCISPIEPEQTD